MHASVRKQRKQTGWSCNPSPPLCKSTSTARSPQNHRWDWSFIRWIPSSPPLIQNLSPYSHTEKQWPRAFMQRWRESDQKLSVLADSSVSKLQPSSFKPQACWGFRGLSPFCLHSYPDSLAVGPDVGRRPVGRALHVQSSSFTEAAFLERFSPGMEQTIHLEQLAGW